MTTSPVGQHPDFRARGNRLGEEIRTIQHALNVELSAVRRLRQRQFVLAFIITIVSYVHCVSAASKSSCFDTHPARIQLRHTKG
jgi:hypothetical protein